VIILLNANHLAAIDAVNEELEELKQQIETMTARKEGMEAAHARIESAAEEMDGIDDNTALIRQAWEIGNRDAVKMLLNSIIEEIDVRVDGILI
jgi:chaperonin cofactor prefoldin